MGSPSDPARIGRRRMVAIVVAALLVIGVAGAVVAIDLDSAPNTVASFNADSATTTTTTTPTTTSTSTTTTTSTSTTTTSSLALQMTQPIAPPSDQRGAENNPQLGRIAIPKIGLDSELHEGIRLTTLDRGPGHWPATVSAEFDALLAQKLFCLFAMQHGQGRHNAGFSNRCCPPRWRCASSRPSR